MRERNNNYQLEAFVYDGPLPPNREIDQLLIFDGIMLAKPSLDDRLTEEWDIPVYRNVSLAELMQIQDWLADQDDLYHYDGVDTPARREEIDSSWWSRETMTIYIRGDHVFIQGDVYTGDSTHDYYEIDDSILKNNGYIYSITESDGGESSFWESSESDMKKQFYDYQLSHITIDTDYWKELIAEERVNVVYPVVNPSLNY